MKKRQLRVSSNLKNDLVSILPSVVQWDPVLQGKRFCITRVEMSSDLRLAKVFVHFSSEQDACLVKRLKEVAPFVQKKMAPLSMGKCIPTFCFMTDDQFDKEREMKALWTSIEKDLDYIAG